MKIRTTKSGKNEVKFSTIKAGGVFKFEGKYFTKFKFGITRLGNPYLVNAICVSNGLTYSFYSYELVVPVEATLVVED
jgi:hypothetical protein